MRIDTSLDEVRPLLPDIKLFDMTYSIYMQAFLIVFVPSPKEGQVKAHELISITKMIRSLVRLVYLLGNC